MPEAAMQGIYDITLRAPDGRERRIIAWLPTEQVRMWFCEKVRKNGLEIIGKTPLRKTNNH